MKKYVKLTETGTIEVMGRIPHVSNPTEEAIAEYAAANGYKLLVETPKPGMYYSNSYVDKGDTVEEVWAPVNLGDAKANALSILQTRRDTAMCGPDGKGVVIECTSLPNGILYNTEASSNAQALMLLTMQGKLPEGQMWTDAADESHLLTQELLTDIATAMLTHANTVQLSVQPARDAVRAAENVDEVEAALKM